MHARMLGAQAELFRMALERLMCSCSHVRRERILMDWSNAVGAEGYFEAWDNGDPRIKDLRNKLVLDPRFNQTFRIL